MHFRQTKSARIVHCSLYGTVRPTNDIIEPSKAVPKGLDTFTEKNVYSPPGRYEPVGPAHENDDQIMVRKTRPIPPNEMIPLTEDGVRSYNNVRDIPVKDTYIERFRSNVTLTGPGNDIIDNGTSREAGNIGFEVASRRGDVVVKNTRGDLAFDPLLDLSTRAGVTSNSFFELTVLSARDPEAERTFTRRLLKNPCIVSADAFVPSARRKAQAMQREYRRVFSTPRTRQMHRIRTNGNVHIIGKSGGFM